MTKLTKAERHKVLVAVDDAWTRGYDEMNDGPLFLLKGFLCEVAHDVLMVLDQEPWRNFGDVLNEVLDY